MGVDAISPDFRLIHCAMARDTLLKRSRRRQRTCTQLEACLTRHRQRRPTNAQHHPAGGQLDPIHRDVLHVREKIGNRALQSPISLQIGRRQESGFTSIDRTHHDRSLRRPGRR
ncbi:hypothetical protein GCM10009662_31530 [Catellatospora coxensis]|uniref:Uncharacterized protein n=1 Tax=Catellatospora coxensis TaxID=310354 RepID=A0A8J3P635_9ACTN|nr:hypothetical protein Cco03nite_17740 [Catellatospora coxensis]